MSEARQPDPSDGPAPDPVREGGLRPSAVWQQPGSRRWAHWPAALLLLAVAVYWAAWFGCFAVPAPDFFEFEDAAFALRAGRLPQGAVRPLLYPALIAVGSHLAPGARPAQTAAQVINLLLGLAALGLIYALCRPLLGRLALLVAWLTAIHWTMAYVVIHPLLEPTFMVCILATLHLARRRSPWRWVAAALTGLARCEGLALVAALALTDRSPDVRGWRRWAWAAGAAAPGLAYLAAHFVRSAATDSHWQVVRDFQPAGVGFLRSIAIAGIGFAPVSLLQGALDRAVWATPIAAALAALVAGLALVGAWSVRRRAVACRGSALRRGAWLAPMTAFAAAYVIAHLFYPAANIRFVLPVLWFYHLLAIMGARSLVEAARTRRRGRLVRGASIWAGASVVACVIGFLGSSGPCRWWAVALALPLGAAALTRTQGRLAAWAGVAAFLAAAGAAAGGLGLSQWYLQREGSPWGEVRAAAHWYAAAAQPGDRLLCRASVTSIMTEYAPLQPDQFLDVAPFAGLPLPQAAAALRRAGATYALWSSTDEHTVAQRGQVLVGSRYFDESALHWRRGVALLDAIKAGRLPDWQPCATICSGREVAHIFRFTPQRVARKEDPAP